MSEIALPKDLEGVREWAHALPVREALSALSVSQMEGLSEREAERRLNLCGPNKIISQRTVSAFAIFLHLGLLLSVLLAGNAAAQDAIKGQKLAQTYCSHCHSIYPDGISRRALATPFREFPNQWPRAALSRQVFKRMLMGRHPGMPVSVSNPEEFAHIIAYIKTLVKAEGSR